MRCSGILMHITSLPGPYGVGTMGKEAFAFVDFLEKAGQSCWQILPLNPTGYGDSPYQSCSTFAGNHYLIDLDALVEEGLLKNEELKHIRWCDSDTKVNFGLQYHNRLKVLRLAYSRFTGSAEFDAFCAQNSSWLPDFALFMALKEKFGGKPWYQWDDDLKFREPNAIWEARQSLKDDIRFFCFVQYLFFRQWDALREYAHSKGIRIIGDVPIYVPYDSVEVWSSPELFQLDEKLDPVKVAGCPPDAFSADGQLWAILCTTGMPWLPTDSPGGFAVWPLPGHCMTWCVWIISAVWKPTGRFPTATRPPETANGSKAPAWHLCGLSRRRCPSWI